MLIEMAAPTPTLPPAAVPSAATVDEPVCVAVALSEPVRLRPDPVPMVVSVVFVSNARAMAGLTAMPPAAPAVTLVALALLEVAERVRLFAPSSSRHWRLTHR